MKSAVGSLYFTLTRSKILSVTVKIYPHIYFFRFGRWELTDLWSKDRAPDPMFEYEEFRSNILDNLGDRIFDKPLCEVMHNQKYFNGIGNYLRAEIIFRFVPNKYKLFAC